MRSPLAGLLTLAFSIAADTAGYNLPTAIAFVPEPGPDPGDPLYFVTELRGTIEVVSNDRTVRVFAGALAALSLPWLRRRR